MFLSWNGPSSSWNGPLLLATSGGRGEEVNHLLADTKADLEEAHWQRARGCHMRANIQWAKEGEA